MEYVNVILFNSTNLSKISLTESHNGSLNKTLIKNPGKCQYYNFRAFLV